MNLPLWLCLGLIRIFTSSSTSLSSFEACASTEISAWELRSGFLLTRWHKRLHEALKEHLCLWGRTLSEVQSSQEISDSTGCLKVFITVSRLKENTWPRKSPWRAAVNEGQVWRWISCVCFFSSSRFWTMAVVPRMFNSTQPFSMSTNQPKLKVHSCLAPSPEPQTHVTSGKDDKQHKLPDYSNFIWKVFSHGTAKHVGTGPLGTEKPSIIAQAECKCLLHLLKSWKKKETKKTHSWLTYLLIYRLCLCRWISGLAGILSQQQVKTRLITERRTMNKTCTACFTDCFYFVPDTKMFIATSGQPSPYPKARSLTANRGKSDGRDSGGGFHRGRVNREIVGARERETEDSPECHSRTVERWDGWMNEKWLWDTQD